MNASASACATRLGLALVCFAAAACGKSPSQPTFSAEKTTPEAEEAKDPASESAGVAKIAPEELVKHLADATCAVAAGCCAISDLAVLFGDEVKDEETCREAFEHKSTLGASIAASVANQRATYSAEAAATCEKTVRGRTCADFRAVLAKSTNPSSDLLSAPPDCGGMLKPEADGKACLENYECTTGYCAATFQNTVGDVLPVKELGGCAPPPPAKADASTRCSKG